MRIHHGNDLELLLGQIALCIVLIIVVFYTAFIFHLLPKSLASIAGKIFLFPMWPFTYLARRSNYMTEMDSTVYLGAVPIVCMGHISKLNALGVHGVVNVCDEYEGPIQAYRSHGITQLHIPTLDHIEPSVSDIIKAVEFIGHYKKLGTKVYIHCKAGSGRSGAIVFCWLLKSTKMTPVEVQEYMIARRRVRRKLFKQPNVLAFMDTLKPGTTSASITVL